MQALEKKQGETAREYAYRTLKYNIVSLELKPGSMVSETELATEMGLSRTPVREALIELAKCGIVEIFPQKGSYVSMIDREQVDESRFIRLVLEKAVVELICDRDEEVSLEALRHNVKLQEFYLEEGNDEEIWNLDNEFHRLLFEICHKMRAYELMQGMVAHFDRVRNLRISTVRDVKVVEDHRKLYEAMVERDKKNAIDILTKHLTRYKVDEIALRKEYPQYFSNK